MSHPPFGEEGLELKEPPRGDRWVRVPVLLHLAKWTTHKGCAWGLSNSVRTRPSRTFLASSCQFLAFGLPLARSRACSSTPPQLSSIQSSLKYGWSAVRVDQG